MDWTAWLGWILSLLLLLVGFLGAWLPVLPGLPVMAAGVLLHKVLVPGVLSWWTVAVFAVTALVAMLFDAAATAVTSKLAGASRPGIAGALLGGFIGLFFGLPGILLGPFIGAFTAEILITHRKAKDAAKAGLGAALGFLAGAVGKGLMACFLVAWFLADAFVF